MGAFILLRKAYFLSLQTRMRKVCKPIQLIQQCLGGGGKKEKEKIWA